MTAVAEVNGDFNNWIIEQLLAVAQEMKKRFEALEAKMQEIVQEVTKILHELLALVCSKTPPTPQQLAEITRELGELDKSLDRAAKLSEECGALGSTTITGYHRQSELSELLQKADETAQIIKKMVDALTKMLAKHGAPNRSELAQMIQEIDQLDKELFLEKSSTN